MAKRLNVNDLAPNLILKNSQGEQVTLDTFSGKPLALIFMRYVGCPVCQMDTIAYKQQYQALKDAGLEIAMVFQSSTENLEQFEVQKVLPFTVLSDPKGSSYKQYGVDWGITGFLSPKNLSPIFNSFKSGHKHGKFEGNEFQYPAVFLIDADRKIRFTHYGETVSDLLSPEQVLTAFKQIS